MKLLYVDCCISLHEVSRTKLLAETFLSAWQKAHPADEIERLDLTARPLSPLMGEALVRHSLGRARELGYRLLIFNSVVENNARARALYERLGFVKIGLVPGGFLYKDGSYQDTVLYYHTL